MESSTSAIESLRQFGETPQQDEDQLLDFSDQEILKLLSEKDQTNPQPDPYTIGQAELLTTKFNALLTDLEKVVGGWHPKLSLQYFDPEEYSLNFNILQFYYYALEMKIKKKLCDSEVNPNQIAMKSACHCSNCLLLQYFQVEFKCIKVMIANHTAKRENKSPSVIDHILYTCTPDKDKPLGNFLQEFYLITIAFNMMRQLYVLKAHGFEGLNSCEKLCQHFFMARADEVDMMRLVCMALDKWKFVNRFVFHVNECAEMKTHLGENYTQENHLQEVSKEIPEFMKKFMIRKSYVTSYKNFDNLWMQSLSAELQDLYESKKNLQAFNHRLFFASLSEEQISNIMNCFKFSFKQWVDNENDHLTPEVIARLNLRPSQFSDVKLSKSELKKFQYKLEKGQRREMRKSGMDPKALDDHYKQVQPSIAHIEKRQKEIEEQKQKIEEDISHQFPHLVHVKNLTQVNRQPKGQVSSVFYMFNYPKIIYTDFNEREIELNESKWHLYWYCLMHRIGWRVMRIINDDSRKPPARRVLQQNRKGVTLVGQGCVCYSCLEKNFMKLGPEENGKVMLFDTQSIHSHDLPDDKLLLQQFFLFYRMYSEALDLIRRRKFAIPEDEATAEAQVLNKIRLVNSETPNFISIFGQIISFCSLQVAFGSIPTPKQMRKKLFEMIVQEQDLYSLQFILLLKNECMNFPAFELTWQRAFFCDLYDAYMKSPDLPKQVVLEVFCSFDDKSMNEIIFKNLQYNQEEYETLKKAISQKVKNFKYQGSQEKDEAAKKSDKFFPYGY